MMDPRPLCMAVYNVFQACGWMRVLGLLLWSVWADGTAFKYSFYRSTGPLVVTLQRAAMLEVVFALLGFMKSSVINVAAQLFARNVVILLVVNQIGSARVDQHLALWLTFFAWSVTESIRFPWLLSKSPICSQYFPVQLKRGLQHEMSATQTRTVQNNT